MTSPNVVYIPRKQSELCVSGDDFGFVPANSSPMDYDVAPVQRPVEAEILERAGETALTGTLELVYA